MASNTKIYNGSDSAVVLDGYGRKSLGPGQSAYVDDSVDEVLKKLGSLPADVTVTSVVADRLAALEARAGFAVMDNIPSSTQEVSPTVAEFNALLDALKAAGLMTPDA